MYIPLVDTESVSLSPSELENHFELYINSIVYMYIPLVVTKDIPVLELFPAL